MANAIRLTWGVTEGAVEYRIYHGTTSGLSIAHTPLLATVTELTYDHTGLVPNSQHYYIVVAVGPNGEFSPPSNEISLVAGVLTSISVTPSGLHIVIGNTQPYTAIGHYSSGSPSDISTLVTWDTTNHATATINSSGVLLSIATGTTNVNATLGLITGSTAVVVISLVSIAVTPANPALNISDTQQMTAIGTYSDSSTQNITGLVTWLSGTPSNATISVGGLVTGLASGTSLITATLGLISGNTTANVSGEAVTLETIVISCGSTFDTTAQFYATGHYSDTSVQDITNDVAWSSGSTDIATIDSNGLVTITGIIGKSLISAMLDTITGTHTFIAQDPQWDLLFSGLPTSAPMGTTNNYTSMYGFEDINSRNNIVIVNADSSNNASGTNGLAIYTDGYWYYMSIGGLIDGTAGTANLYPFHAYINAWEPRIFTDPENFTDGSSMWVTVKTTNSPIKHRVYRWWQSEGDEMIWQDYAVHQDAGAHAGDPAAIHEAFNKDIYDLFPESPFSGYEGTLWTSALQAIYRNSWNSSSTYVLQGSVPSLSGSNTTFNAIFALYHVDDIGQPGEVQTRNVWFGGPNGVLLKYTNITPSTLNITNKSAAVGSSIGDTDRNITGIWAANIIDVYVTLVNEDVVEIWHSTDGSTFTKEYNSTSGYSNASVWGAVLDGGLDDVYVSLAAADGPGKVLHSDGYGTWTEQNMPAIFINNDYMPTGLWTGTGSSIYMATGENIFIKEDTAVIPLPCIISLEVISGGITNVNAEETLQLDALATFADESTGLLNRSLVSWSSADTDVATVDAYGLVTGVIGGGTVDIHATIDDIDGHISITVPAPTPVIEFIAIETTSGDQGHGATITLTTPTNIADDLMLAIISVSEGNDSASANIMAPEGWSFLTGTFSDARSVSPPIPKSFGQTIFYKFSTGGEDGEYTFQVMESPTIGDNQFAAAMMTYRYVNKLNPFNQYGVQPNVATFEAITPNITTTTNNTQALCLFGWDFAASDPATIEGDDTETDDLTHRAEITLSISSPPTQGVKLLIGDQAFATAGTYQIQDAFEPAGDPSYNTIGQVIALEPIDTPVAFTGISGSAYFVGKTTATQNAISASITIETPLERQTGDLLIAIINHDERDGNTGHTFNTPDDWTLLDTISNGVGVMHSVYYRVAIGEASSYIWTASGGADLGEKTAMMLCYRGINTTTPIDAFDSTSSPNTANIDAPSITASKSFNILLCIYSANEFSGLGEFQAEEMHIRHSITIPTSKQTLIAYASDTLLPFDGDTDVKTAIIRSNAFGIGGAVSGGVATSIILNSLYNA